MKTERNTSVSGLLAMVATLCLTISTLGPLPAYAVSPPPRDLPDILKAGVIRHLGVPYANFVTGSGDGLDVELIQRFAAHLGVRYAYVQTTWEAVIGDLTGKTVKPADADIEIVGQRPIRGDLIANGFTILPWRQKIIDYGTPTFPTQIWVVARADAPLPPISPGTDIHQDIALVKGLLGGHSILGVSNTCLEPSLYNVAATGAKVSLFQGNLNELAPAIINGESETTLLDVPDALIALEKWPGQIKVIGPLSPMQAMGAGFSKQAPRLRAAYNEFIRQSRTDGSFAELVKKYYPAVFRYYPDFFENR
ncbi:Predicted ABC transporter, periplasmic binding protein [Desulfosarcina cetonica]|nr:Predicted ABC transporter, periplasmic binding protein [Desulfosarcina cetonica]